MGDLGKTQAVLNLAERTNELIEHGVSLIENGASPDELVFVLGVFLAFVNVTVRIANLDREAVEAAARERVAAWNASFIG